MERNFRDNYVSYKIELCDMEARDSRIHVVSNRESENRSKAREQLRNTPLLRHNEVQRHSMIRKKYLDLTQS